MKIFFMWGVYVQRRISLSLRFCGDLLERAGAVDSEK